MKHPLDNQTVDWCEKATPKFIETELGREKFCKHCQEYWPLDHEFFGHTKRKRKSGTIAIEYQSLCKSCYKKKYRGAA